MKLAEIKTDRLVLVPLDIRYAEDIFRELTPEIVKYMSPPSPKKLEETLTWMKGAIEKNENGEDFGFVIVDKKTGAFIGGGGVHHLDRENPTLGIWIKKSAHGHGYGMEAVKAAKEWAEESLDYGYLKYDVAKENIASRKIPEALGGVVEDEYPHLNGSGEILNLVEYRIYKK